MARRKGTSDRAGAFFETTTPTSRNEQLIRRYVIRYSLEFVVIFLGVVVSFNVQRMSEKKSDTGKTSLTRADIFANDLDLPLFILLEDRSHLIRLRVMSLEYYIA